MTPHVDRLLRERMKQYESSLRRLVDYLGRRGAKQDRETLESALAEKFIAGEGGNMSPETQKLHDQYAALLYLSEMLRQGEASVSPPKRR